jgi:hypothetical protein
MGPRLALSMIAAVAGAGAAGPARAQDHAAHRHAATDQAAPDQAALERAAAEYAGPEPAQMPYAVPRQTLIPGTPGMAGGFHLMVNGYAFLANQGLGGYSITNPGVDTAFEGGATRAQLQHDWVMGYGRDDRGRVEGLLMLDLEPLTVGPEGIPELGQSGEGLWDAQHSHYLIHQAMVAVHPLAWLDFGRATMMTEPLWDLSLFGGQGSATIGPPVFMHRASSPGPTVPRKHHKGENPHETSPVFGAALRYDVTVFEASVFGAEELGPDDSRYYPHAAVPNSFAARVRRIFARSVEVQISGERLKSHHGVGTPDVWQASASAYLWRTIRGLRVDALLDWALDRPDGGPSAQGALAELAVRSADRRAVGWMRSEFNQRVEPPGSPVVVSSPWLFETAGFEYVGWGSRQSGLQLGVFAEATYTHIPEQLAPRYGRSQAVAMNVGLHLFGMWMLDGSFRRMYHDH